jgi:hypothetical protein
VPKNATPTLLYLALFYGLVVVAIALRVAIWMPRVPQ